MTRKQVRAVVLAVAVVLTLVQVGFAIYVTAYGELLVSYDTSSNLLYLTLGLIVVFVVLRERSRT